MRGASEIERQLAKGSRGGLQVREASLQIFRIDA